MKTKIAVLITVSACIVGYFVMTAWADELEIDEYREKAAVLLRDAEENAALGHADEARELERQAQALRAKANKLAEHHERRELEKRGRDEERERNESGPEQIEHIRIAAEHLHAAGMRELAEDLMRQAEERERDMEREREGHRDEGLHRHVEELSNHVRELHQRLERMENAIRELSERRDG